MIGYLILEPLKKYVDFTGRASRLEFWTFILFIALFLFAFSEILELHSISQLFLLFTTTPLIAASIRRVNDGSSLQLIGKLIVGSMWVATISIVLIVTNVLQGLPGEAITQANGILTLASLYFLIRPSQIGPNEYGQPPLR